MMGLPYRAALYYKWVAPLWAEQNVLWWVGGSLMKKDPICSDHAFLSSYHTRVHAHTPHTHTHASGLDASTCDRRCLCVWHQTPNSRDMIGQEDIQPPPPSANPTARCNQSSLSWPVCDDDRTLTFLFSPQTLLSKSWEDTQGNTHTATATPQHIT